MADLYVVTAYWNPLRYRSRRRLYEQFRRRMADDGVKLLTVELSTDDLGFEVTRPDEALNLQLRSDDQLWYKENLINIGLRSLPDDWEFAAWIDADVAFVRPDWPERAIEQLGQHAFVQLFSHIIDLGPRSEPIETHEAFTLGWIKSGRATEGWFGQPGGAWSVRRDAFERIGRLIDWSIMGSNDYFSTLGLVGAIKPEKTRMPGSAYASMLLDWQARCEQVIKRDVGYLDNTLLHYWHGRKADRGYDTRWKVLVDNEFDPLLDLKRDPNGLLRLTDRTPALRSALTKYFMSRNEDATEL